MLIHSVPSKRCACTRLSQTALTHKFTAHKHIMMKQCSRLASWGKLFLDLLKQGFLTKGAGLINEKLDICGRDDLFFVIYGLLHKH